MTSTQTERDQADRPRVPHHRLRRAAVAVGLGGLAVLVLILAVQELLARNRAGSSSGITIANYQAVAESDGRPAPPFTFPSLQGDGNISLPARPGQVVVLNFWASWCAPCRVEADDLEAVWERYRERGVRFIGVDYRDDDAAGRAFVDEFDLTYPSAVDDAGALAFQYEVVGMPTTFVIGPDGAIVYRFTGRIDAAILSRAVDDALGTGAAR